MGRIAPMKNCDKSLKMAGVATRGFTLLELLVTVAIVVVLLGLGMPSLQGFITQRAVVSQADAIASSLRLARTEALKRALPVTMCLSTDTDQISPSCVANGNADWEQGWLTFVDNNANGDFDAGELLLRVQQPLSGRSNLKGSDARLAIHFTGDGLAMGSNVTFTAHADSGDCRQVVLAQTGRQTSKKLARTAGDQACS